MRLCVLIIVLKIMSTLQVWMLDCASSFNWTDAVRKSRCSLWDLRSINRGNYFLDA